MMNVLLLTFSFLLLTCPSWAGTLVQKKGNTAAGATSVVATLDSATLAHSTIIVAVRTVANSRTFTVTDSASSSYTLIDNDVTNNTAAAYYLKDCPSGITTVTFSVSGGATTVNIAVHEVSGLELAAPLDKHVIATGTSANVSSGATAATTQANEYVFGFISNNAAQASCTNANDTSYTVQLTQTASNSVNLATEDKNVAATGAQTAQFKNAGNTNWFCGVATFKDAIRGGLVVLGINQ